MAIPSWVEPIFFRAADRWVQTFPRKAPSKEKLKACKLIAHRGVYDNCTTLENTLEAFDNALALGIWGIELDIRWTRDLTPVVIHDPDCRRLHAANLSISETTLSSLTKRLPKIPTLAQAIDRYAGKLHLMVEIKSDSLTDPARQNQILSELFSALTPKKDFHIISLNPEIFDQLSFAPPECLLPIARLNVGRFSQLAIEKKYGGLTGHFALIGKRTIGRHHHFDQKVGTGFINSQNALFREINRGVDWIFSDCAETIQNIINPRPALPCQNHLP